MGRRRIPSWNDGLWTTLALFTAAVVALHFGVEVTTGVNVVHHAANEFLTQPIPSWTWPTWLTAAFPVLVVASVWYFVRAWERDRNVMRHIASR